MRRVFIAVLAFVVGVMPLAAFAVNVQVLTTPSGVPFWLVAHHGLPLVGVRVAFKAGAVYDPEGQEGVATLTASLLNESVGKMDAKTFAEHMQGIGSTLNIFTGDDVVGITLMTLRDRRDEGVQALADVLSRPAFTRDDTKRMREAILAQIREDDANPAVRAAQELRKLIYGRHPYGHPANGYEHTLSKLGNADVRRFYNNNYTRTHMTISVAGDITAEEAAILVDKAVADVPQGQAVEEILKPFTPPAQYLFVERDIPQTHLRLGHLGIDRNDEDYPAAQVLNYILGGGGFVSRLMKKIRDEKGLVYGVRSSFQPNHIGGTFEVNAETRNETAEDVIRLIKEQIRRIRAYGVEADEYRLAQDYLLGSFPLESATTTDLLSYLTIMQMENLGPDYLNTWPERVKAVTREDIFKAANRLLDPSKLVVVAVGGKPLPKDKK
jgi:zinc protease